MTARKAQRKILGQTGDVNLFEYDAGIVYKNVDGVQWEWWQWMNEDDESGAAKALVYRCDVPYNVFKEHGWASTKDIASFVGSTASELREMGTSSNTMERVWALEAISSYYGSVELDNYPLELTRAELKKRWRGRR
jgi:hypothetical protein